MSAAHHIGVIIVRHHLESLCQHILGCAGARVGGGILDHAADFIFRVDRMPDLHGLCTGKEHVVADQRFDSVVLLAFGKEHAMPDGMALLWFMVSLISLKVIQYRTFPL